MYSVTRNIGIASTIRTAISIKSDTGQPQYDCDIKSAVISSGWETHIAKAGQLLVAPVGSYDHRVLYLKNPKFVFAKETGTTLVQSSTPPVSGKTEIALTSADITRLDSGTDTDGKVTLEFRLVDEALAQLGGEITSDYNRLYLTATSALSYYNPIPASGTGGATEPGVVYPDGTPAFDADTDLYILVGEGGAKVQNSDLENIYFPRTDIISDPTETDIVIGAVDIRNTTVDDVTIDLLRGSATALVNVTFRLII